MLMLLPTQRNTAGKQETVVRAISAIQAFAGYVRSARGPGLDNHALECESRVNMNTLQFFFL